MGEVERQVIERVEELATRLEQRSWLDRVAIAVVGSVITAMLIGLAVTVIDLKVSNAHVGGQIERLADRLEAAVTLANTHIETLADRQERIDRHVDSVDIRVQDLEKIGPTRYRPGR